MSDALSPNETTAILAYLDGELSPAEASDVEALLQRNVSARVLLKSGAHVPAPG
jgi:anti-sigma factor RsiW